MYKKIDLPSRCLVYPGVAPEDIKIRTFKGKDEKFIASLNYENLERKFADLLRNVLQGIAPEELTVGDRFYVLVWETINSYTPEVDIEIICKNCFQRIVTSIDLSQLEVAELPDNFQEPYSITLSDGSVVSLRLFRVKDEIQIADYEKRNPNSWLYRYALSLIDDRPIQEKIDYLENLEAKDLAKIRAFHDKFYHGPIMESKYVCPKCQAEEVVDCPFRLEWILPFGKTLVRTFGNGV